MEDAKIFKKLNASFLNLRKNIYLEKDVYKIEQALTKIAKSEIVKVKVPDSLNCLDDLKKGIKEEDIKMRESALIELYIALHQGGRGYSDKEEELLKEKRGLKGLPGGILPVIIASHLIEEDYVFVDLGAGNGLQGLLLQYIFPHRLTRQIELAKAHLDTGSIYENQLGFDEKKILYENIDILSGDFSNVDFIYMYRPVRPIDSGLEFYKNLYNKLKQIKKPHFILSVADCFEPFLGQEYKKIYENEFLKVFKKF